MLILPKKKQSIVKYGKREAEVNVVLVTLQRNILGVHVYLPSFSNLALDGARQKTLFTLTGFESHIVQSTA